MKRVMKTMMTMRRMRETMMPEGRKEDMLPAEHSVVHESTREDTFLGVTVQYTEMRGR